MKFHVFSRDEQNQPITAYEIHLDEIYYWIAERTTTIVFYTIHGVFYKTARFEELALLLKDRREIVRTERVIMVNTKNVVCYNSQVGKVFFEADTDSYHWTYISQSRISKLRTLLGAKKDIADKNAPVYTPLNYKRKSVHAL